MGKKPKISLKNSKRHAQSNKLMWVSDKTNIISRENFYQKQNVKYVHMPWFMLVLLLILAFCIGAIFNAFITFGDSSDDFYFHLGKEQVLENQLQSQKQTTYECLLLLKDIQHENLDNENLFYTMIPKSTARAL